MDPLTLALPTGRLFDDAVALLRRLDVLDDLPAERSLVVPGRNGFRLVIVKPADIPTYVEYGAADAGIVGKDVLLEQGRHVYELFDLGFGACRGVVALPEDRLETAWRPGVLLRIATKYPQVTTQFFAHQRRPVEIVAVHGSVELAPRAGLADGIMDLVMTGRTLRENGLVEAAEVFRSTARLIVNRVSLRTRAAHLRPVFEQIEALTRPAAR
ncbi:MAG: ATP phosphoribosyltransferase [Armatimonadota bacterium]|nr:ATP phosphoribosyltransferase [Armatimonadota bacterium]MDR7450658.1 ATP phosphoribosyltransferase [Armatimonadota bacterium]MDR7466209.1 ATP phosphoribosyltransferase [Armatimonadota bacterium]MDR7492930.1 ATP phosphoribosyltransferase [Armatimonadota bacterium]MDR7498313.1 ATP phosphoribosyltransferase [Armatimonadota bacterium]